MGLLMFDGNHYSLDLKKIWIVRLKVDGLDFDKQSSANSKELI